MMLKNKGDTYSKLITYFVSYALEIIYVYSIYIVEILHNGVLLCISSQFHIHKIGHGGGIHTLEINKLYKSGLDFLFC